MFDEPDKPSKAADASQVTGSSLKEIDFSSLFSLQGFSDQLKSIFTTNVSDFGAQFKREFNDMEKAVISISYKFGGNREFANEIKQSINGAAMSVIELGGGIDDVINIQKGVIEGLGTQTILTEESYQDLYASLTVANDGIALTKETVSKTVTAFSNAGISVKNVGDEITKVMNTAKQIGVDASQTFDQIEKNMSKLQLFNFQNGVEGMAKMAAHAVNMRVSMDETLKFADGLFDPSKAMEMSATFQRLGVNVTNLLDPYKLMDMARNDPGELQKSLAEAMEQLTYFDEKSKTMKILPEAQGVVRQMSKDLGMSIDYMVNLGTNSSMLSKKMSEIVFPSFAADQETQTMIANMATLGSNTGPNAGKWTVNIAGQEVAIENLTEENKKVLEKQAKAAQTPAQDAVSLQKTANDTLMNMLNQMIALNSILPRALAASPKMGKSLDVVYGTASRGLKEVEKGLNVSRKTQGGKEFVSSRGLTEGLDATITKSIQDIIARGGNTSEILDVLGTNFAKNFPGINNLNLTPQNLLQGATLNDVLGATPVTQAFIPNNQTGTQSGTQGNVQTQTGNVVPINNQTQTFIPNIPQQITVVWDTSQKPPDVNVNVNVTGDPTALKVDDLGKYPATEIILGGIQKSLAQQLVIAG